MVPAFSGPAGADGRATPTALVADAARTEALKPEIVDAIQTVYDPEIPVNIWELGLIYDVIVDANGVAGDAHDADRARLPRRAVAARRSRARTSRPCRASPTPWSTSCGSRRGPRTACPTPPSSSWGCGDAPPVEESRLRADGHEASHGAPRRPSASAREIAEAYDIPVELMAKVLQRLVRRGLLASHQGTRGGYRLSRSAVDDFGCRRHPGDRRPADRDRLLDRRRELRPVLQVQHPRPAVADQGPHRRRPGHLLAAGDVR